MNKLFKHYWWIIICFLCCGIFYEQTRAKHNSFFEQLTLQLERLQEEQQLALSEHEKLQLEINSQSDPAWIEMTLVRKLGMIPGDSKKVIFLRPQE